MSGFGHSSLGCSSALGSVPFVTFVTFPGVDMGEKPAGGWAVRESMAEPFDSSASALEPATVPVATSAPVP